MSALVPYAAAGQLFEQDAERGRVSVPLLGPAPGSAASRLDSHWPVPSDSVAPSSARSEAVGAQHPAAALLAAAERKDSQASRGLLPVCPRACGPCVCLGCVGVRRGSLPGGVQHAVNRALLRVYDRET